MLHSVLIAVAKGIRRIVALTGNEAHKAINKGSELLQQFEEAKGLEGAELNKRINSLGAFFFIFLS